MEEMTVITKILKAVRISVPVNIDILQLDLKKQPSEVLIKLKNQLDFYKDEFSKENYEKYSNFLRNLLRDKRLPMENGFLATVKGNEFDFKVLPNEGKFEYIVQGVSLWALSLHESLLIRELPHSLKFFEGIVKQNKIRNLGTGFERIKGLVALKKIRNLAFARVLGILKNKMWWKGREGFLRYRRKVVEKVNMIKMRQRLMESYKKKNVEICVEEKKGQGIWWVVLAVAIILTFNILTYIFK